MCINAEFAHDTPEIIIGTNPLSDAAERITKYIETDSEIPIPIDEFFDENGNHITKKKYGQVVLKHLCIELREKFNN